MSSPLYEEYSKVAQRMTANGFLAHVWVDYATKGMEERLIVAAELLKEYGEESLPALLKYKDRHEMEYFMTSIAGLVGVHRSEREVALRTFLDHKNPEIAHAAVNALAELRAQRTDVL